MSPRAKEFDPDVVLDKAMDLFWEKGYEATSIKNLVDQMGINRFSLYSTFGDKHKLFLSACDRYRGIMEENGLGVLESSDSGLSSIRQYFNDMVDRYTDESGSKGCFMTNSTVELAPHDAEAAETTGAYLFRQQQAFYKALGRAQETGELDQWTNINDSARSEIPSKASPESAR